MEAEGYLNDRRYAERLVTSAQETGKYVGYRLRQELKKRGISGEIADELVHQDDSVEQLRLARQLVQQKYHSFDYSLADERERRRVAAFLQRRGFGFETIIRLLNSSG